MRLIVILSIVLLPRNAPGQEFTLAVDVPLVSFDVSVVDARGLPVADLEAVDVEVWEDGVLQTNRYFGESTEPFPYYIQLLFDSSGSTANRWSLMAGALEAFVDQALPAGRLSTGVFGSFLHFDDGWTHPAEIELDVVPLLESLESGRSTQFYRAVGEALGRGVFDGIDERRILVVMTDGRDSSLYRETLRRGRVPEWREDPWFTRLVETVRSGNVPVYFIAFNTDRNIGFNLGGTDEYRDLRRFFPNSSVPEDYLLQVRIRMEEIARVTGGQVVFPESMQDLEEFARDITRGLGDGYSIGYSPRPAEPGEGVRHINVRVARDEPLFVTHSQTEYQPQ